MNYVFRHLLLWIRSLTICRYEIGHALKPEVGGVIASFFEGLKKLYITKIKGFDLLEISVATLLFEGTKDVRPSIGYIIL